MFGFVPISRKIMYTCTPSESAVWDLVHFISLELNLFSKRNSTKNYKYHNYFKKNKKYIIPTLKSVLLLLNNFLSSFLRLSRPLGWLSNYVLLYSWVLLAPHKHSKLAAKAHKRERMEFGVNSCSCSWGLFRLDTTRKCECVI